MTRIVVTGADGFVGRVLVNLLLSRGLGGCAVRELTAVDLHFAEPPADAATVRQVTGSLADAAVREEVTRARPDAVFHLASVPGGAAERDYALGRRVNLDATLALLESFQNQPTPPRFVYASSIAVYGEALPALVDEAHTVPAPALTYGTHKLACEHFVADASRRGWVEGCSLRLPAVVARSGDGVGLMSAFMSQIFWRLAKHSSVTVPVRPQSTAWWISATACAANLAHAATLGGEHLSARRTYLMPALRASVAEVVAEIGRHANVDAAALVTYEPQALIERLFGSYPPLSTLQADAAGFRHDGTLAALVCNALAN